MAFGLRTQVGPGNHVLDGGPDPPWEWGIFGKVKYRDTLWLLVWKRLNRSLCRWDYGIIRWGSRSRHEKGQFWGKGAPIVKCGVFLPWAVQKWLNQLICHLGCGLQWAHIGGHIGATWLIRLNHVSVAAMQFYVKLLWPLVCCHCGMAGKEIVTGQMWFLWCKQHCQRTRI